MICVLALDSENVVHEVHVENWKNAMFEIEYLENSFTLKQVFLTEHKEICNKKKREWAKWLSE